MIAEGTSLQRRVPIGLGAGEVADRAQPLQIVARLAEFNTQLARVGIELGSERRDLTLEPKSQRLPLGGSSAHRGSAQ